MIRIKVFVATKHAKRHMIISIRNLVLIFRNKHSTKHTSSKYNITDYQDKVENTLNIFHLGHSMSWPKYLWWMTDLELINRGHPLLSTLRMSYTKIAFFLPNPPGYNMQIKGIVRMTRFTVLTNFSYTGRFKTNKQINKQTRQEQKTKQKQER